LFSLCNFTIMYIKMHRKIFNRIIRKQNVWWKTSSVEIIYTLE
jgi:hypothetical protein